MTPCVLVHGMWHGGWCWKVVAVMEYEDLHDVMLVGHSLAGFMAPAVAERILQRLAHVVNLDGVLPVDGKAFKDLLPDYWADFRNRARAGGDEARRRPDTGMEAALE